MSALIMHVGNLIAEDRTWHRCADEHDRCLEPQQPETSDEAAR